MGVVDTCCCLCQWVVGLSLRDFDTPAEVRRKKLFIPVSIVGLLVAFIGGLQQLYIGQELQGRILGQLWISAVILCGLVSTVATGRLSLHKMGAVTAGAVAGILIADLHNAAAGAVRLWPLVVLIMDLHLATDMPRWIQGMALHTTGLWLIIDGIEMGLRLGFYSGGILTQGAVAHWRELADCAAPPCAQGAGKIPAVVSVYLLVLYADFFATRGFAEGLRKEQAKVQASVLAADQVTASLARFDLASAEEALATADEALPAGLAASLVRLLRNLASYRPYLPQSCFESDGRVSAACDTEGDQSSRSGQSSSSLNPAEVEEPTCSPRTSRFSTAEVSSAASSGAMETPASMAHLPVLRRVALLHRNRSGMLVSDLLGDTSAVSAWIAAEVERFYNTVRGQGGVTDLLSGDHLSASFGAVKAQGTRCANATRTAVQLAAPLQTPGDGGNVQLPVTQAVCSGRALCGDFGSNAVQRFMVIGPIASVVHVVERTAASWGVEVLIDSAVFADAEQSWHCRLRGRGILPKLTAKAVDLWEVVEARAEPGEADEWMYELAQSEGNPWRPYNAAVAAWCSESADAAQLVLKGDDDGPPGNVRAAAHALRMLLQAGAAPPQGRLAGAEWLPAPVRAEPAAPSARSSGPPDMTVTDSAEDA